ncbi:MAG: hypothetical protein LUG51_17945 [Tannerellaceae bacterium]|nr:hypothetical protein [Tannerellaceae bacterium]
MGKTYQGMGAYALPEGDAEIIGYYNGENGVYKLHLLDDKLIRWEFEPPRRTPNHHNHTH